jgi:hypothetical protein
MEKIRTTKEWTPDVEETARKALSEFEQKFKDSRQAVGAAG